MNSHSPVCSPSLRPAQVNTPRARTRMPFKPPAKAFLHLIGTRHGCGDQEFQEQFHLLLTSFGRSLLLLADKFITDEEFAAQDEEQDDALQDVGAVG